MNAAARREHAADLIEQAYGRNFALSIIAREGRTVAQIWTPKGTLMVEYDGADERAALIALASSPAFKNFR